MFFSGKILLTGAHGQLGYEIIELAKNLNISLYSYTHEQLDIIKLEQIKYVVATTKPNYIINTAAYTSVDKAEKESEIAFSINCLGVKNLAKIAKEYNIPLIHISTDYVFDGQKKSAYTEQDITQPISIYGKSKLSGENLLRKTWYKHIILRVSWIFGRFGNNFVKTILRLAKEKNELKIIADQRGAPTYAGDIALTLIKIIDCLEQGQTTWGTYHYTGKPALSWYEFSKIIIEEAKQYRQLRVKEIFPISTLEYPSIARRPFNSELNCQKISQAFNINPNNWFFGLQLISSL
ncbi:MAG: hypothetical protein RLY40_1074 [Pseudomonadota bacterium]|jgi:dTDP-4-dehydrorhamnose reductase